MSPKCDIGEAAGTPVHIAVLGAPSVGKTSLTLQFITGSTVESDSCQPTIETSFIKELHLNDNCTVNTNNNIGRQFQENGAECLWSLEGLSYKKPNSSEERRSSEPRKKSKSNNNDSTSAKEVKVKLKITDTAGYKPVYNPRKSLRERLALKFTPRRRTPVSTSDAKIRKRYLRVMEDNQKEMSPVPSFIYRKPNGKIGIHESLFATADAFILVYNIRDRKSFDVLSRIRQEIRTARGCSCTTSEVHKFKGRHDGEKKSNGNRGSRASCALCSCKDIPSVIVVGTHMDTTSTERIARNVDEKESTTVPDSASGSRKLRKRTLHAQVSFAVDLLSRQHTLDVSSQHVQGVIGTWEECAGYAEVSNNSVDRVQRLFEHLTSEVMCRRLHGRSRSVSSPRKRIDSVLSVFSRKSVSGYDDRGSCLTACFR